MKNKSFIDCIRTNDIEGVKLSLEKGVNPSVNDNYSIRYASQFGFIEIVKLLLQDPRVDPSVGNNYAIRWSSYYGHLEIVKILLKDSRVDSSDWYNYAIRYASQNGHLEIVKLLLQDNKVWDKLSIEEKKKYSYLCRRDKLLKLMNK